MAWQGLIGILALLGVAWLSSERRAGVSWRLVASGVVLQFAVALVLLRFEPVKGAFEALNHVVLAVQAATLKGTAFVFGYLGGGATPFEITHPENTFILAIQGLSLILTVSVLAALLFHWRVIPVLVQGLAWGLRKTLGIGGAEGFSAAANVFVGMIEAPLLIKPYLRDMSRSGLFIVMTAGMATIAGNMFVLYAAILAPVIPDAVGNLLTASLISAPAAITVAALMVPALGNGQGAEAPVCVSGAGSSLEAIVDATLNGAKLVVSVAAMLVVVVTLVSLCNQLIELAPSVGGEPVTLQRIVGWGLAPIAWLLGVPWEDAPLAGQLLGTKVVLNELIAYLDLAALPADRLDPRSDLILTYALCGFANLGSLGILMGGLGAMVPERKADILALGPKTLLSGNLASFMTGAVVGLVA